MNQFYAAQLDAGTSKQTLASAGFTTSVAISRRRSRTSSASASTSTLAGEDKGHDPMADPVVVAGAKDNDRNNKTLAATLAENQRPMYAIPSEGWLKQPDSWGYASSSSSSSEEANRQSMLLRQFPATWQSTRRLFGRYLLGSSASVDEDRASVRISGALDDPARSAWRSVAGAGAGAGGAGEVVESVPGGAAHQHTRSPSPPPLPPPPPVISSRRRLLSVAALTGADEPVYPVLSPPTTTSVASATAIPATRFYS